MENFISSYYFYKNTQLFWRKLVVKTFNMENSIV
ncbi:hypothetical protein KIS1582_4914, partial [Cytobacillus firmus]